MRHVCKHLSCFLGNRCGAPPWQVWRLFDAKVATVNGPMKAARISYHSGLDSSLAVTISRFAGSALRWLGFAIEGDLEVPAVLCPMPFTPNVSKCVLFFSPFDNSCVRVEATKSSLSSLLGVNSKYENYTVRWRSDDGLGRRRRVVLALTAFTTSQAADWLAEATTLHFAIGVSTGVLASAVIVVGCCLHLCGNGLGGRRYASRFRVATLVVVALGYATMLWQTALGGVAYFVRVWPISLAIYLCVSIAASVAGTTLVLRSGIVTDFVSIACRVAALFLAFNSTHSITAGFAFAIALCAYNSPFAASAAFVRRSAQDRAAHHLKKNDQILEPTYHHANLPCRASVAAFLSRKLTFFWRHQSAADYELNRPGTNFLHDHRYLSIAEYDEQSRRCANKIAACPKSASLRPSHTSSPQALRPRFNILLSPRNLPHGCLRIAESLDVLRTSTRDGGSNQLLPMTIVTCRMRCMSC